MDSVKLSRECLVHLNWIKLSSNSCGLDSSTGRAADRYPEGVSSNPAGVNIFQLTSAMSDYHEKIFLIQSCVHQNKDVSWGFNKNDSKLIL